MPRDMPTLVVPKAANVPVGNVTATEWTDTKNTLTSTTSKADRADTRVFDARKYDTGGGFVATMQAATDAAFAAGGGTVAGIAGNYNGAGGTVTMKDGVYYEFPGSGSTTITNTTFSGSGSLTALPALSTAIAKHGREITFASAPDVQLGDVLIIYDSADGSFNPARSYYRAGEFVKVRGISGNTVFITTPTHAQYLAASTVTVHRVNPIRTGISGATIRFASTVTGIKITLGTELRFDDLPLTGTEVSHLTLARCYDVKFSGVSAFHYAGSTYGYGVTISNCQDVAFADCFLDTWRHGLTIGGEDVIGCVPNRNIKGRGGRVSGMTTGAGNQGLNMHGNVEYIDFDIDAPAGVTIAGDKTRVRGRIRTAPHGVAIQGAELLGWSHDIDVAIESTASHVQDRGVIYLPGTSNITRTGGTLKIRGSIDTGVYTAIAGFAQAIYVLNNGGSPLNDIDINVRVNSDNQTYGTQAHGVRVAASSINVGGAGEVLSGFRDIEIAGRVNRMGVYITCSPRTLILDDLVVWQAPVNGVWWGAMTNPFFAAPIVRTRGVDIALAGVTGMNISMPSGSSNTVDIDGGSYTNCNQGGTGTSTTGTSVFVNNGGTVIYRNAVVGDTSGAQVNRDAIHGTTTLIEENIIDIGAVPARSRGTITSHIFHGRGAGAPTFAAANGSTYIRTDGGAASTFYVREAGSWVAK